jgi:hypothetical protein
MSLGFVYLTFLSISGTFFHGNNALFGIFFFLPIGLFLGWRSFVIKKELRNSKH